LTESNPTSIDFLADKVYVHQWPLNSPVWSAAIQEKIDFDLNKNKEKKKILIEKNKIKIDNYFFTKINKIGVTVPLFKKETTMVFEGNFGNVCAHIHITTFSKDFLEIFNRLMSCKSNFFPDSD